MTGAKVRPAAGRPDTGPSPLHITVEQIDALLPQTQCRQCGFDGCLPYAEAIRTGQAAINRCPPGGHDAIEALATLTGRPALALDPSCGGERAFRLARIDEPRCIGCTLCIQACPVDAIIGAPKKMHVVLGDLCTGCELCIAPCPVDCIVMEEPAPARVWSRADADAARRRFQQRNTRLARLAAEANETSAALSKPSDESIEAPVPAGTRRAVIQAAIARARAKRARSSGELSQSESHSIARTDRQSIEMPGSSEP